MNFLDIIFIIPIAWFAYQGFKRGFIIELTSLAALILGIYAAIYFSGYAANFLINSMGMEQKYVPITSFMITFIAVVVIVYFIGKILEKVVNMIALGLLNKMAGIIFGILKAAVFLSITLLIINHFNDDLISREKKKDSLLYSPIAAIAPWLWKSLEELNLDDSGIEKLKENVDEVVI
jgi:membrane protein required for colicin V production